jgi:hypothetical protein
VEVVAGEIDGIQFGVGDFDAGQVSVLIEFATNEPSGRPWSWLLRSTGR